MRINKFIAHSGVCSRREAEKLILEGLIYINGKKITCLTHVVEDGDNVIYKGERLISEKKVYYILNKPPKCICSAVDPQGRNTIVDMLKNETSKRIYPVGRLDYLTRGLIIVTNDGWLTTRLAHPKKEVLKSYNVLLNRELKENDLKKIISKNITLNDGVVTIDKINVENKNKSKVTLELHSGKNRIIRRLFAHLGYRVIDLKRTNYAMLSLKNLDEGKFRTLSYNEILQLKTLVS